MKKGAIISDCGKYRYQLWRIWDESKPTVLWMMHNPSTADGETDDPTIRRIINFSKSWGYGGLYVANLTPYRATDPKELLKLSPKELFPEENWLHIAELAGKGDLRVIACGNPVRPDLIPDISAVTKHWKYLKLTKLGFPSHPLYLKSDLTPQTFNTLKIYKEAKTTGGPIMKKFYFTFGQEHVHPKTGRPMRNYYIEIIASSSEKAREIMFSRYGAKWSFQYEEGGFKTHYFPGGIYETIAE